MQLMKEVDLVKSLSHPSIVKYEGMARDENTLSIVLECVLFYRTLVTAGLISFLDMPRMDLWAKPSRLSENLTKAWLPAMW